MLLDTLAEKWYSSRMVYKMQHPLAISKAAVCDEGSCNNCNNLIDASGRYPPDAWIWNIELRTISFRLCSDCMTLLKTVIKEKVK